MTIIKQFDWFITFLIIFRIYCTYEIEYASAFAKDVGVTRLIIKPSYGFLMKPKSVFAMTLYEFATYFTVRSTGVAGHSFLSDKLELVQKRSLFIIYPSLAYADERKASYTFETAM